MITRRLVGLCAFLLLLPAASAEAHHGIASLGVAGLEGPGAPIEMSSPVTLYFLPGLRGYWRNLSLAFGVDVPIRRDLDEEDDQQGGEGKELYGLVGTLSIFF
jgi:hypothetical protein